MRRERSASATTSRDDEGEKIVVVQGCERIAVQEGEKGDVACRRRAGEAGEAAEETRDAPRESGEVAPKPNEEESEQNETSVWRWWGMEGW